MKSGFYMTRGDDQLSVWTKKKLQITSQSQTCTKKVMVTVWWSAASPICYSFLNPCETITSEKYAQQIDEMHQKLKCLKPARVNRKCQFFSVTTPTTHLTTNASEVDNDQLRAIIKADPLTTTWEVAEELNVDHSTVVWHLKQTEKVKKLDKWLPHELKSN